MNDDLNIVASKGTNEITIGENSKLMVVKKGEERSLTVKSDTEPRWVWIATEYIEAAKKILPGQKFEEWGEWKNSDADTIVDKYGIYKQYVYGKGVSTKIGQDDIILKGTIYYFEAFREIPTLDRGHYVATIDKPQILSAYFAQSKDAFKYPGESGTSDVYTYKTGLKLFVLSHLIPDYTKAYHNFALFEVTIWNCENDKEVTTEPLQFYQKTIDGKFTVNTLTELDFIIDEKWRDKANHTKGEKEFYAKIKTTVYANEDAVKGSIDENGYLINANENPSNRGILKSTNKFNAVSPNNEEVTVTFTSEDEAASKYEYWWFFEGRDVNRGIHNASNYKKTTLKPENYMTKDGQVLEDQQVTFKVRYENMDVILDQYEAKKNNMFAVVGDIEYTSLNNHPCKYSKITIEHKSRPKPFVLFDEDAKTKKVVDHTDLVFGIVAGDVEESITIKAEGLAIQSYQAKGIKPPIVCDGITTTRKIRRGKEKNRKRTKHKQEEFIHNTIEDVFNMDKAYILFPERRMITTGEENFDSGEDTIDIAEQGIGYEALENGVKLKLAYLYNKNYDNQVLNFLAYDRDYIIGSEFQKLIQNIWVIRYLIRIAKGETLHQSYFVPIGTCRYPNQLARIAVYPDMKWVINFHYNIKEPLYYNETPTKMEYLDEFDGSGNNERKQKVSTSKHISTAYQNQKSEFAIYVECEISGKSKFKLGSAFAKKFRKMISPLTWMVEKLDTDIGVSKAKNAQEAIKLSGKTGLMDRLKRLPMSFELTAPNLGVGFGIGYGETQSNDIGYELEGRIIANPLLGAKISLDVLALGSKFKPWGLIIDALDIAAFAANLFSGGKVEIDYKIDIVFSSEIKLVGADSKDNTDTPASVKYNFLSGDLKSNLAFQGIIKGEIEISFNIQLKSKKRVLKKPDEDKYKKVGGLELGAKASSYVKLTVPTQLNVQGDYDIDFYFSGVVIEVWAKVSLEPTDRNGEPDYRKRIIPKFETKKSIKFFEHD